MRGGLGGENGVASLERLLDEEMTLLHPPVFGASRFRPMRGGSTSCRRGPICAVGGGIGGGPVFAKSGCALGCAESCRSRSRGDARVARREDVGGASAVGTGQDLAGS